MPSVLIVDYGMSNLASIKRALEICGAEPTVSDKPSMLGNTDKIILPGVGSFDEGMKNLRDKGWLTTSVYHDLYRKSKGGFFRSTGHLKLFMEENNLFIKK